jgi:hypothetical protein
MPISCSRWHGPTGRGNREYGGLAPWSRSVAPGNRSAADAVGHRLHALGETVEQRTISTIGTRQSLGQGAVPAEADQSRCRHRHASASACQPRLRCSAGTLDR